jgi:hypothetical protein
MGRMMIDSNGTWRQYYDRRKKYVWNIKISLLLVNLNNVCTLKQWRKCEERNEFQLKWDGCFHSVQTLLSSSDLIELSSCLLCRVSTVILYGYVIVRNVINFDEDVPSKPIAWNTVRLIDRKHQNGFCELWYWKFDWHRLGYDSVTGLYFVALNLWINLLWTPASIILFSSLNSICFRFWAWLVLFPWKLI